jgi:fatty-acid desaturase
MSGHHYLSSFVYNSKNSLLTSNECTQTLFNHHIALNFPDIRIPEIRNFHYFLMTTLLFNILLHVRFPWQHDVGALSHNYGIVQHCCVSLVTQQFWTALASLVDNNVNKQHCYTRNNRQAFPWLRDCLSSNFD